MGSKSVWRSSALVLLLLTCSGCDASVDSLVDQAKALLGLSAKSSPKAGDTDAKAEEDLELIGEMYRVVFVRDTLAESERQMVSRLAATLNQGASLEGLYNGLTHSAAYRTLENKYRASNPGALQAFARLLGPMEADLPAPTVFDASAAEPLAEPVEPSYRPLDEGAPDESPAPTPSAGAADPASLSKDYLARFSSASFFTLKRVLGDEAIKLVASRAATPEKLALWYSKWAVQMAGLGIDFGLALRNSTDENFHYRWARSMSRDRVEWEVLNRVQRILNSSAGGKK